MDWMTPYVRDPVVSFGCLGLYAILGAVLLRAACVLFNWSAVGEGPGDRVGEEVAGPAPEGTAEREMEASRHVQRREAGVMEVVSVVPEEPGPPAFGTRFSSVAIRGGVPVPSFPHALVIAVAALVVVLLGHDVMDRMDLLVPPSRGVRHPLPWEREATPVFVLFAYFATAGVLANLLPVGYGRACLVVLCGVVLLIPLGLLVGLGVPLALGPPR